MNENKNTRIPSERQQRKRSVYKKGPSRVEIIPAAKMLSPEGEMERVIAPGTSLKAEKAIIFELEKAAPYRRGVRTK